MNSTAPPSSYLSLTRSGSFCTPFLGPKRCFQLRIGGAIIAATTHGMQLHNAPVGDDDASSPGDTLIMCSSQHRRITCGALDSTETRFYFYDFTNCVIVCSSIPLGREIARSAPLQQHVLGLAVRDSGAFLVATTTGHRAAILDAQTLNEKKSVQFGNSDIYKMVFCGSRGESSSNSNCSVFADTNGQVTCTDLDLNVRWQRRVVQYAYCVASSPDGLSVAVTGYDPAIKILSVADGALITSITATTNLVYFAYFLTSQHLLVNADTHGTSVWDVANKTMLHSIPSVGSSVCLSQDRLRIVSNTESKQVRVTRVQQ